MKAVQKRDLLVKDVLKPMLKAAGFKSKRMSWWKELEDGYLFLYMKNSQFNCEMTGCSFCFQFSVSAKEEIRDKIENQWIYNQMNCIEEKAFLPHLGYLSPNRSMLGYKIDGYRNYQPTDVPAEEILAQIKNDFETYIMPHIMQIQNVKGFEELKVKVRENFGTKEDRLLRYYSLMHMSGCSDSNLQRAVQLQKEFDLTAEDIRSHYDWLEIIEQNSEFPMRAKPFIEKALMM